MSMSNYLESGVLNHIFRSATFSKPTTVAVALTTDYPTEDQTGGTINEIANAGSYARVDLGAPADADWNFMTQSNGSGLIDNVNQISFPQATANWGHASGVVLLDSATYGAGNVLMMAPLPNPRDIQNNDTFSFGAGDLDILLN